MRLVLKRLFPIFAGGLAVGLVIAVIIYPPRAGDDGAFSERASRFGDSLGDLRRCNEAVDQFTADKKTPPKSIKELVEADYLKTTKYPAACIP